eukprot:6000131-Prymnesium_polylepis.1
MAERHSRVDVKHSRSAKRQRAAGSMAPATFFAPMRFASTLILRRVLSAADILGEARVRGDNAPSSSSHSFPPTDSRKSLSSCCHLSFGRSSSSKWSRSMTTTYGQGTVGLPCCAESSGSSGSAPCACSRTAQR